MSSYYRTSNISNYLPPNIQYISQWNYFCVKTIFLQVVHIAEYKFVSARIRESHAVILRDNSVPKK